MSKIILLSVLLMGCRVIEQHNIDADKKIISIDMNYYKDSRTNLCFATHNLGTDWAVMTNVPCTPEVEKLLK